MSNRVGAPPGARVHWLLLHLSKEFTKKYILLNNYSKHEYVFLRYKKRKLYDIFIITRTSIHRWKCVYFNAITQTIERCSTRKSVDMAYCMEMINETYDNALKGENP